MATAVAVGIVIGSMGATAGAAAQDCRIRGDLDADLAKAFVAKKLHDTYAAANRMLLEAVVKGRLVGLGFMPSDLDRSLAAAHLAALDGTATTTGADITWPSIELTVHHPAAWLGQTEHLATASAETACGKLARPAACETTDPLAAAQRAFARTLLARENICRAAMQVEPPRPLAELAVMTRATPRLSSYFWILAAEERYKAQYRYLADLSNAPFQRGGLDHEMLYADFFHQSLMHGSVSAFAPGYFAPGNPLEKYALHQRLRPIISVLLDSRLLQ